MKTFFKNLVSSILIWESKLVIKKYKPKIVAVTGSVGKTSTKDAIYTVLASTFHTRKSQKSFNSEIGVPLTILGCQNGYNNPFIWTRNIIEGLILFVFPFKYPEWLVLEVGADRPGDIKKISEWLKPDIAVITRFGDVPVHIEFFPSIEDLVIEKGHLARGLKDSGIFIYNNDDKRIADFSETIHKNKISYGFNTGSTITASHEETMYAPYENSEIQFPKGMRFRVDYKGSSVPLTLIGALGKQHIYPLLAAFSVGISQDINPATISQALSHHKPPRARMRIIDGIANTIIIDDTYNSSPVAVEAGLTTLKKLKTPGRKIAILGDMMELGEYSANEHRRMGELAADAADVFIAVGIRTRASVDSALDAGMDENNVLQFDTSKEAGVYLAEHLGEGDMIYVKGSQSMRMERTVEELMEDREDKENLLVRQERQWLAKK